MEKTELERFVCVLGSFMKGIEYEMVNDGKYTSIRPEGLFFEILFYTETGSFDRFESIDIETDN